MPGRQYAAGTGYRYGFNGKENDNEPKGLGNQQDYGLRIYDPRTGKFLSSDPLSKNFPWNSAYAFAENGPIANLDLDGGERKFYALSFNAQNEPILTLEKTENFVENWKVGQHWDTKGNIHDDYAKINNPYQEFTVTYSWKDIAYTEALAFEYTDHVTVKFDQDPATLGLQDVSEAVIEKLESYESAKQFRMGIAAGMSSHLSLQSARLKKTSPVSETPEGKLNKQVNKANESNPSVDRNSRSNSNPRYITSPNENETSAVNSKGGQGKIYIVPGTGTESGKPYVGRTIQETPAKRGSSDKRNRTQAKVVDTFDPTVPGEGSYKEQKHILKNGGVFGLDNKRNEVSPERMKKLDEIFKFKSGQ